MTINGYTSRNIPNPKVYEEMLERRMAAKKSGDKATANALKLVANTTYGAMLNAYNELYDPLMGRSVCISGQLYLLELAEHLTKEIPNLVIVQLNTDGIMIEFDASDYGKVLEITGEWQKRTGFELEEDSITMLVQKDVNNYIEVQEDGKTKCKGGYLVRGIAPAGAFNVNNNYPIVSKAVTDYFVNGTAVEDTINGSDRMLDFQIIAKASGKYGRVYQEVIDPEHGKTQVEVQRCNRVYASKDMLAGTLFKTHKETGSDAKVGGLPEHCLIDNDNSHTLDEVDKQWYINLANQYIDDFLGTNATPVINQISLTNHIEGVTAMTEESIPKTEKKEKKEAQRTPNIYDKLSWIRKDFREAKIKKTGINPHAEFKYFELENIIPVASPIIDKWRAIFVISSVGDVALGQLIDLDNPESAISFSFNGRQIAEPAKFRMNETQARGAEITYQRRYLYALMLDLCDADEIEKTAPFQKKEESKPAAEKPQPKKPATTEKRKEIVSNLTSGEEMADELMLKALKNSVTTLLQADGSKKEFVKGVMEKTKNFTEFPKAKCIQLIDAVNKQVVANDDGELPF